MAQEARKNVNQVDKGMMRAGPWVAVWVGAIRRYYLLSSAARRAAGAAAVAAGRAAPRDGGGSAVAAGGLVAAGVGRTVGRLAFAIARAWPRPRRGAGRSGARLPERARRGAGRALLAAAAAIATAIATVAAAITATAVALAAARLARVFVAFLALERGRGRGGRVQPRPACGRWSSDQALDVAQQLDFAVVDQRDRGAGGAARPVRPMRCT